MIFAEEVKLFRLKGINMRTTLPQAQVLNKLGGAVVNFFFFVYICRVVTTNVRVRGSEREGGRSGP